VTALGVFAIVVVLLWVAFSPLSGGEGSIAGSDVVPVPPRGDVAAVFLDDGRPVFVVHHLDGTVTVVDAFSSHRAWGIEELNVWCPSTREFVELAHETRFDEYGDYAGVGPAPGGIPTFSFEPVDIDARGDLATIRIGAMRPASPGGSGQVSPPDRPELCPGPDEPPIVAHAIPESEVYDSPAAAVEASPDRWIAVPGTLVVASDGFVQLCGEVVGERCVDGAIVRGIDGIGLMLNVTNGPDVTAYEEPHVWLARVRDGVLDDIADVDHALR
jgi:hypothetical protein